MTVVSLTQTEQLQLLEIQRLHDEAFEHYQKSDCAGWKSGEGAVSVHFGNFWERDEGQRPACSVYSYALGPNRDHYFDTIGEALEAVQGWHKAEMEAS